MNDEKNTPDGSEPAQLLLGSSEAVVADKGIDHLPGVDTSGIADERPVEQGQPPATRLAVSIEGEVAPGDASDVQRDRHAPLSERELLREDWLIPTNRYNLIEILTSGIIKPLAGYKKYYKDLLVHTRGRVPILRDGCSQDVVDALSVEDPSSLPVLLRLVDSPFDEDFDIDAPVLLLRGVLPAGQISEVLVRSDSDRTDLVSRQLANLNWNDVRVVVEPTAFQGPIRIAEVDHAIADVNPAAAPSAEKIEYTDRVKGALAMAFDAVRTLDELLTLTRVLAGKSKLDPAGELGFIATGRLRTFDSPKTKEQSIDSALFEAAVEVVLRTDPMERWSARAVLGEIWERLTASSVEASETFEAAFEYIRQVIGNETDIRPFRADASPAPKALLMFLLRPKPDDVASWRESELKPRQPELVGAAALSGALTGYAQIPTTRRSGYLGPLLDRRQTEILNRRLKPVFRMVPMVKLDVEAEIQVGKGGQAVVSASLGGQPVHQVTVDLDLETLLDLGHVPPDTPALVEKVRALGWGDECGTSVVAANPREDASGPQFTLFDGFQTPTYEVDLARLLEIVESLDIGSDVRSALRRVVVDALDNVGSW